MNDKSFNPWPLGIIAVYGTFATLMIGFVIWSASHQIDLVAPDYYAQEIAYQQEIDALERSLPYVDQIQWNRPDGQLEIAVADPLRQSMTNGLLRFYRPSDSSLDHDIEITLAGNGRFRVDTSTWLKGFWRARIEWQQDDEPYAVETSLFL